MAAANVGLLDETPPPELVVVGTSFSNTANFAPFLSLALGSPVENVAISGGGPFSAARGYFAKPEFAKSPPRAVVWEIPERMLEEDVPAADEAWAKSLGESQRCEIGLELFRQRALSIGARRAQERRKWLARPWTKN